MKAESASRKIIIEQDKRFSTSALWRIQKDYFDRAGINAWVNSVPFYITSNPFIAKTYARIMLAFVQDWTEKHPESRQTPFYIMEIGTGSGRFSYYFVKTLDKMRREMGLDDIKICHVMSDFTRSNMRYWETHHAIRPLVEAGLIDFALYDMEADRPVTLVHSGIHLNPSTLTNPLTVFGNYIFDTCLNDLFALREEKLYELHLSLATEESNMRGNWPDQMEKVDVTYHAHPAKESLYGDPLADAILEEYRQKLKETIFLMPVGAFHTVRFLKKISNNRLLMLSTDKGYSALSPQEGVGQPPIYFHGSFFSAMVNFYAIGQYFKNGGGDSFLQTPRRGIKTSAFSSGFLFRDMPRTHLELKDRVEGFSPADYFTLHRRMSDCFGECSLDTLAAHLELAGWDPHIYLRLSGRVAALAPEGDRDTLNFLSHNMATLADNFYDMPKTDSILFEIGVFFHAIKNHAEAVKYYEMAIPFLPEKFGLSYNLGLCLHALGREDEALTHFRKACTLDPDAKEAAEWVHSLENGEKK